MHPSRVAEVPSCPGRAPVALVLGHCRVPSIEYFLRGRLCRFRSTLPLKLVLGPSLSILHCLPQAAQIFSSSSHHYLKDGPSCVGGGSQGYRAQIEVCHSKQLLCIPAGLSRLIFSTTAAKLPSNSMLELFAQHKNSVLYNFLTFTKKFLKKTHCPLS